MKLQKLFSSILASFIALSAMADIAEPGLWQNITLQDGTVIRAELRGDEYVHWWQTTDGQRYALCDGKYVSVTPQELNQRIAQRRMRFMTADAAVDARQIQSLSARKTALKGQKKGIIILVQFKDMKFSMDDPQQYYYDMANKEGYNNGLQVGSIHDYFCDQSAGQFLLNFDIIGPVTMSESYSYYGKDSDDGEDNDVNVGLMIVNAISQASSQVNWKDYDWNDDNEVDQIYIIYAGRGQSTGGGSDTVWPHKSWIRYHKESGYKPMTVDGITLDVYACSNELRGSNIAGIGAICHEFSHCLGFPDMYDSGINSGEENTNYGMGTWDLMSSGDHNNNGFCPPNYSSWEKMTAGWIEPTVLSGNVRYDNVESQANNGESFIVYNQGNMNEYYLLQNRQQTGWDRSISGSGLMIQYIDYDNTVFNKYNAPNTYITGVNDHQRLTIFHADNKAGSYDESTDLYPNGSTDMLSNYTTPAATVYNTNVDGTKNMNIRICDIRQNEDGTISFVFGNRGRVENGVLFSETFEDCTGTGANDGNWGTFKVASSQCRTDEAGWQSSYIYGGYHCARIGTSSTNATAETAELSMPGEAILTFRAAPYTTEGTQTLAVSTTGDGISAETNTFQLQDKQWSDFTTTIKGKGTARLVFSADCRFYLDEVVVKDASITGISELTGDTTHSASSASATPSVSSSTYDITGRRVSDGSISGSNTHGLYIHNSHKVIR